MNLDINDFENFDFGAAFGFGALINLAEWGRIEIGFRTSYGFLDIKGINGLGQTKSDLEILESNTNEYMGANVFNSHAFKVEGAIGLKIQLSR